MNEKRYLIEDALHAIKAAVQDGVVIGGGAALLYSSLDLETIIEDLN